MRWIRMVGLWWYGWVLRKRTEGAWLVANFQREESCEGVILGSGEKLTEDLLYGWCVHLAVEMLSLCFDSVKWMLNMLLLGSYAIDARGHQ